MKKLLVFLLIAATSFQVVKAQSEDYAKISYKGAQGPGPATGITIISEDSEDSE